MNTEPDFRDEARGVAGTQEPESTIEAPHREVALDIALVGVRKQRQVSEGERVLRTVGGRIVEQPVPICVGRSSRNRRTMSILSGALDMFRLNAWKGIRDLSIAYRLRECKSCAAARRSTHCRCGVSAR